MTTRRASLEGFLLLIAAILCASSSALPLVGLPEHPHAEMLGVHPFKESHFHSLRSIVARSAKQPSSFHSVIAGPGVTPRGFMGWLTNNRIHGLVLQRRGFYEAQAWVFYRTISATAQTPRRYDILEMGHDGNVSPWDLQEPEALWHGVLLIQALKSLDPETEKRQVSYSRDLRPDADPSERFRIQAFFTNWGFDSRLFTDARVRLALDTDSKLSFAYSAIVRSILEYIDDDHERLRAVFALLPGAFADKAEFTAFAEGVFDEYLIGLAENRPIPLLNDPAMLHLNAQLLNPGGFQGRLMEAIYKKIRADRKYEAVPNLVAVLLALSRFDCGGQDIFFHDTTAYAE